MKTRDKRGRENKEKKGTESLYHRETWNTILMPSNFKWRIRQCTNSFYGKKVIAYHAIIVAVQ